ncbi:MAG: hypothetical protein IKC98_07755, partial [Firmicutes bacterium]|nr:hypothetical protein [Bacillota bacterium]
MMKVKHMQKLLGRNEKVILEALEKAGYEAHFVGGCVRDALMGRESGDADVTTNALPQQVKETFTRFNVIETGIKHGTVTVILPVEGCDEPAVPVEITTYRSDGTYSDSRHPDRVVFVRSLEEDLARRDFTVNAMACSIRGELIDPYGGQEDLAAKKLRTVGDPDKRFK